MNPPPQPKDGKSTPAARRSFKTTDTRDFIVSLIAGLLAMGAVIFAITNLFDRSEPRGAAGVIVGKEIVPRSETQFSVGVGGLKKREIEGQYLLKVRTDIEERVYLVYVRKEVFDRVQIGDPYYIVHGADTPPPPPSPTQSVDPATPVSPTGFRPSRFHAKPRQAT